MTITYVGGAKPSHDDLKIPEPKPVKTFEVGQRVKLSADTVGLWRDASVNRMAKLGRSGTIREIIGAALPPAAWQYTIEFDCFRRKTEPVWVFRVRAYCVDVFLEEPPMQSRDTVVQKKRENGDDDRSVG